jgi:hypothetical protein
MQYTAEYRSQLLLQSNLRTARRELANTKARPAYYQKTLGPLSTWTREQTIFYWENKVNDLEKQWISLY